MAQERIRHTATILQARGVFISGLWNPQTKDFQSGKPLDNPRYSMTAIVPKTTAKWSDEPILAPVTEGAMKLWRDVFQPKGYQPGALIWPVKDGDLPNRKGVVRDWAKGHWLVIADTTNPDYLQIEMVDGGKPVKLDAPRIGGRVLVKDGDYCMVTVTMTESGGTLPGIKTYLQAVLFTGAGDPIQVGSGGIDQMAMLERARAQGIEVKGFGGAAAATPNPFGAQQTEPNDDSPF